MPSHNEPVQPARFDVADNAATESRGSDIRAARAPGRWVAPTLALLVALVLLVVFWLPGKIDPDSSIARPDTPASDAAASTPTPPAQKKSGPTTPAEDKSPWADAQQARLRLEAQDILAELLDIQFALEEQGVKIWAPTTYSEAAARATEGDTLYRSQKYSEASVLYRESLGMLQDLRDNLPDELARLLEETRTAIARGDVALATTSLTAVLAMDPEHEEIPVLQKRLQALPQVLENLAQARRKEDEGDLDEAAQLLSSSLELDPLHKGTAQALDRIKSAMLERDFQAGMSRGYSLLGEGQFQKAKEAFNSAQSLKPGSAEVTSALLEVDTAATSSTLAALQNQGKTLESQERWQEAVLAYERALNIDSNVLYASEGIARSRERAHLDKQFRTILDNPQRLSEEAVANKASDFLRHARQISPRGKVLQSQVRELETLLRLASTPVAVTLRSDMETEVIVYKIARLGKFQQQELSLRPGTYTAVGTRIGYRDVRKSFTVDHAAESSPVTIVCSEPI